MGRGEWLPYETYILSMNGVTYKNRKTFPRLCVGIFGYDLLSKITITGQGSNRNGNVKKPEERLDPNKILAIKGNLHSTTFCRNFAASLCYKVRNFAREVCIKLVICTKMFT